MREGILLVVSLLVVSCKLLHLVKTLSLTSVFVVHNPDICYIF